MDRVGQIERITDGVAWGTFQDGMTFDLPVDEIAHIIGDEVRMHPGDEDTGSDHFMMVLGQSQATLFWLDETDEGYEIAERRVVFKNKDAMN